MKQMIKRGIAFILVISMMMQVSHIDNYRYIDEVFATSVNEESVEEEVTEEEVIKEESIPKDVIVEEVSEEALEKDKEEEEEIVYSYESDYEWSDFVVEQGIIEEDYEWSVTGKLTTDLLIKGNLVVNAPLNLNGYTLTVEGDVEQQSLIVVNGQFVVQGSLYVKSGDQLFDKGAVNIGGNYVVDSDYSDTITMEHDTDYLIVSGDILFEEMNEVSTTITAGTIELEGDFIQKDKLVSGRRIQPTGDFKMEKDSILLLSGKKGQNIYVCKKSSGFEKIVVDTSDLNQDEEGNFEFEKQYIGFSGLCQYESYEDNGCPTTYGYMQYDVLPGDIEYLYGSSYYIGEPIQLVNTLTVLGDFIQNAGLYTKGNYLHVAGDYRIQSLDKNGEYGKTQGFIDTSNGGSICVYGDFYTESVVDHTELLKGAYWMINGDLHQIGKDLKNFTMQDYTCRLEMGQYPTKGILHVVMDNPIENSIYTLYRKSSIVISFDNGAYLHNSYSSKYQGFLYFNSKCGTYYGDVKFTPGTTSVNGGYVEGNVTIDMDLKIGGAFSVYDGDIKVENSKISVTTGSIRANNIHFTGDSALSLEEESARIDCEQFTYEGNFPLSMEGTSCSINCKDFYYASKASSGELSNGSIVFTGDFYVKDVDADDSFVSKDNHKVCARGEDYVQHITIENPASCIETLEVSNYGDAVTICSEGTVVNNVIAHTYTYAWDGVEGFTLEQDVTYDEDFVLAAGTLDLNGHTLTVNGDFFAGNGVVYLNGGHLIVNGNMELVYRDWSTDELVLQRSKADIVMDKNADSIDITGNWHAIFKDHSLSNMTNGTVYLGGDMLIEGSVTNTQYTSVTEEIMGGTNLHLTGEKKQTISGVSKQIQLHVGDFICSNETELAAELPVYVAGVLELPKDLDYSFYNTYLSDIGKISNHVFKGNLIVYGATMTADTVIDGSIFIDGVMDMAGYELTADRIIVNQPVTLSKGTMITDELEVYNKIYMQHEEDLIKTKLMYVKVTNSDNDYMTDGEIHVEDLFSDSTSSSYAFLPSGNHTFIFTKTDATVENPVTIRFSNNASILNRAVLRSLFECYETNREKEDIAKEVILGYEDTEKPMPPTNLQIQEGRCFSVRFTWDEASDDIEVYRYKIYRDGQYLARVDGTAYTDIMIDPNTEYEYTVTALDVAGNESEQSTILLVSARKDMVKPYYDASPKIKVTKDKVEINCSQCFLDDDSYVDYYIITKNGEEIDRVEEKAYITYTSTEGYGVRKPVRDGTPIFEDTGLEYGVTYKYGIQAVDFAGNKSDVRFVETMADLPPIQPTGFNVTTENGFNIISFHKSGLKDTQYYCIQKGESLLTPIYNMESGVYTYVDKYVEVGQAYSYRIVPYNRYDTAGIATETIEVTTIAEATPPVITSLAYSTLSEIVNEPLEVIMNATDEGGMGYIYAYIVEEETQKQQEIFRKEAQDKRQSFTVRFTMETEHLKGNYDLHLVAVDHCGNEKEIVKKCRINVGGLPAVEILDTKVSASAIYMEWNAVEDAAYYVVEAKEQGEYVLVAKTSDTYTRIEQLDCDTDYTYRVVAYDANQARGIVMDDVTITTASDSTKPQFTYLLGDGKVLGYDAPLSLTYEDDVKVATLYVYYRKVGNSNWNQLEKKTINNRTGRDTVYWDKSALSSGAYEVKYLLEDSSGNCSDEIVKTYILDVEGPVIENLRITPKDWTLQVDWDAFIEEDYRDFELKRISLAKYNACIEAGESIENHEVMVLRGTQECIFSEMIDPYEAYMYRLYAYDTNGNKTVASVSGTSIDNDIFAPTVGELQDVYAAKGYAVSLTASGCYDNDEIVSYEWDLGNGETITGEICDYIYEKAGTYNIQLKVTDGNGNYASSNAIICVGEDVGILNVKVVSGDDVLAGADVVACINGEPYHSGAAPQTNDDGKLEFPLQEGTYKIAAYKSGYLPKEVEVSIAEGENKEIVIDLEKGEMITASFETKEMSKKEMEEAGIDTTENKAIFEYTVNLEFESKKIEKITFNNWKGKTHTTVISGSHGTPSEETGERDEDIIVSITNVSDDPGNPIFFTTKSKRISIDWLQNIYQVDVTLSNCAGENFSLEAAQATLLLEKGLGLAQMNKDEQDAIWDIGTLKSGESSEHTWYVGGKQNGSYPLKMKFEACLQPYNLEIKEELEAKNQLYVTVGEGLHLYIYPEAEAYIGESYYVQFKLANESEETFYNVTANFGQFETAKATAKVVFVNSEDGSEAFPPISVDTGMDYFVQDETAVSTSLDTNDRLTVKQLKPGKSIYGTWRFQFDAGGDVNEDYYKLLTAYVREMDVANTNVDVTLEAIPGHLSKKAISVKVPKKKEDNTPPPDPDPDEDKDLPDLPSADDYNTDTTETVKDPINLMTGAFMSNHVVAAVSGATNMQFALFYNSMRTEQNGDFGKGWYHNYEMRLERQGSFITFYQNPNDVMYFAESDETKYTVCGEMENGTVYLLDDANMERTYYQMGASSKQNRIEKNADGYILYMGNEQYVFNQEGVLVKYVNASGQSQIVEKTEEYLVIKDPATGKMIKATYDKDGHIVRVEDAAGNATTFAYKDNCMSTLTGKKGTKLIYEYDTKGRILVGKEGDGTVFVENTYDEKGRVLSQVANQQVQEKTKFTYKDNEDDKTTTVTMSNADGTKEEAVSDRFGQGIRYTDAIGGVKEYTYNAYSDLTAYRYADGAGADYTYDENGNITQVVETTGKTTQYTYDKQNRVTKVVCNDGTNLTYTYNENGQLASLSSANGLSAEYSYNEYGQILEEKSALGTIEYTYEDGMLRRLKDYSGNYHYFTYDENGNVIQYIDGAGIVTDYKVDVSGRVEEAIVNLEEGVKSSTKYTYDAYGNITSKTDANGNTTQYIYNVNDLLEKEIRPDGTAYTYSYDQNGNVKKIVCPDGVTTAESVYDAAGNALSLTDTLKNVQKAGYSAGGQLLKLTQANGGEVNFEYYDNGLLKSQTDANGNQTTLTYDEAGRIISVTDGSNASTSFSYDKDGNLSAVENALGKSIIMEYNQYRKVVSQTDANGNLTRYSYDKAMNCTKVTDAEGGITEFVYDARGQITSMTKKGQSNEQDVTLSMTYDNLGNVTSLTDGEGNTQTMEYDQASQLLAVYDAYGAKTESYTYDCLGNCITVTDAFGNVTTNSYDALGNLVKQLNESTGNAVTYTYVGGKYLASSSDALDRTASYTYDSMGNVETLTNPNGGVTSYKYDLNNNLTDEIIGEDYHVRYTYNAQNLAATKTNSRGQQTTYSYDALGRIVKQEDEAGIIEYTYDSNDNVLTVTETIGEQVHVITRTYDGLNRVTSYEDAKGNRIGYSYDKIGNLTKLTYPNGKEVTYTYNKNCSISSVTDWNRRTTTYGYDKNGRLIETKRPNGTVEKREYDKAGHLTLILDMSGDKVVNRQEYSYDASGNITSVKQLYNGEAKFTEVTTADMTYDKNNRLLTYNGEDVKYDKDGNMTYGPLDGVMSSFEFDCRNRLVKAGDTSYEYDAENNRIAVTTGTKRTEYVVNSQPELSQVLQSKTVENNNEESAEITYYYYGQGLLAQENSKGYLTYHFNNVGSTMAVTDQNGAIKSKYNYSPYGELIEGEYDENIQFLYNGQYGVTTDGNGLYYMRARYYNVDIKRFINQDVLTGTLERISSLNRYSYVEGNPVSYLDPFGLERSIYDDWHDYLQEMMYIYACVSAAAMALYYISPDKAMIVSLALALDSLWVACADFGVCIGRAWEGVFENDYEKIDSSYEMMDDIATSLLLTLEAIVLDSFFDKPAFGFLNDLITILQGFTED